MDYVKKTNTFIAFVNTNGKDRYWIDGNYVLDEISPKIYPYETKEQKDHAFEMGQRNVLWDDTGNIEGIILKVDRTIQIAKKSEAKEIEEKYFPKTNTEDKEDVKPKRKERKIEKDVPSDIKQNEPVLEVKSPEPEPILEESVENSEKRKPGRPKKILIQ